MGLFNLATDIGVDLGTASVLIYVKGKGVVVHEPSVVAIDKNTGEVIAIGEKARKMLGRTPANIEAIRPLRDGVIADYNVTEKMLKYFIEKACGKNFFFKPRLMVCIPSGVTEVEERAVRQAAAAAGARQAFLMEEPLAAAMGANMLISEPSASMVVDIGGGTTDIAVISLGGIVCSTSLRVGGDKMDDAIVRYARREHNLLIGERFAEDIKRTIGTADLENCENRKIEIRGRDMISGLPKSIEIDSKGVATALAEPVSLIVAAVKDVLEKTPPELATDIIDKGIIMTGGGSLLAGLDTLISCETGVAVYVAESPVTCVALGTAKALNMLDSLNSPRSFARKAL